MNTICAQTSDDAIIKFGAVFDDTLGDAMRVTVVATGLNRPSDFAAGAKRSLISRLVPGSTNQVRGGGLRENQPHSVLRQTASQSAARPGSAQHELRTDPAPHSPASRAGEDA